MTLGAVEDEQVDELKDEHDAVLHLVLDAGEAVLDVRLHLLRVLKLEEGADVVDNKHSAQFLFKHDFLRPNLYHDVIAFRTNEVSDIAGRSD